MSMSYIFIILFTIPFHFFVILAQEDNSPLIPSRKNTQNSGIDYVGVKDPFAPKTPSPEATSKPAPSIEDELGNQETISNPEPSTTNDNLEKLTEEPTSKPQDSWEQELLHGKDEDFKPAPLKLETDSIQENESSTPVPEVTPTPTTTFILPEESASPTSETSEITTEDLTPTATPTPTPIINRDEMTKEQIKPADLITEEIDPWDDPRKKVSTHCRLQLERIKKKKIMIDRADGTYMKLQDSLKQKNVDQQKAKQLIDTLEAKIKELKKEIQYLKEKAIRQGCPGVYF